MNIKVLKFIGIGMVILLIIFSMFVLFKSPNSQNSQDFQAGNNNNLEFIPKADEIFSQADMEKLQTFVNNFILLYNTYSFEDFSNLTALFDYQSQNMRGKTQTLISNLEKELPPGYFQETQKVTAPISFKLNPNLKQVSATVQYEYRVYSNYFQNLSSSNPRISNQPILKYIAEASADISLIEEAGKWYIDHFEIKKSEIK